LDSLLDKKQQYEKEIKKYSDTVMVLSAVYHTLKQKPAIAEYVAVETSLTSQKGTPIEPDLTALYDKRSKGILFEFKWSLPFSDEYLEKVIDSLGDYSGQCSNWKNSTGTVVYHDLILVCHMEDASRATQVMTKMASNPKYSFLVSNGFAVWTWIISISRRGGCGENLILTSQYGNIRNQDLEKKTQPPTGLVFTDDALTWLRSSFQFIKMKPPVQYTIIKLIQHIFPQFQDSSRGRDYYELTTDMIYETSKKIFFPWRDSDTKTIQAKRSWIVDALEKMYSLRVIGKTIDKRKWIIPIPTLRPRVPLQETICKKLAKYNLKVRAPRKSRVRTPKSDSKVKRGLRATSLMDFPH
jgi:hypothetical protein